MTHYTKGTQSPRRAPTACTHTVSDSISLPSTGFFSPFPHGTSSLSVGNEYLGLEGGPPMFRQDITCPALLDFIIYGVSRTGLSPAMAALSRAFRYNIKDLRPGPRSLAATKGISVDFFSSGYLDVSVPRVRPQELCIHSRVPLKRWVSPFGNPRIKACLSAPRGLSQITTSFIACCRQGIHHVRLFT